MFFFGSKIKLTKSDLFDGLRDSHSHILPGVDDGLRRESDSLDTLEYFEKLGIKSIMLTPHINTSTSAEHLQMMDDVYEKLRSKYSGNIELTLAAEYMLDSGFKSHMEEGLRYLSPSKRSVLVETSYVAAPNNLYELLYELSSRGETVVLAHPERYMYMSFKEYHELPSRGYELQLNIPSLLGFYGKPAKERAEYLLSNGLYTYLGSDIHSLNAFRHWIEKVSINKKILNSLMSLKER